MMNRKTIWIALLLAGLASTAALAYGTWCCLDWMAQRHAAQSGVASSPDWAATLALSAAQRGRIEPLQKKLDSDVSRVQVELAENRIALCRLMMTPGKADGRAVERTLAKISSLETRKEEMTSRHLLALRQMLTPDQQKRLFTALMKDICQGCRAATGNGKDLCGMCGMRNQSVKATARRG